MVKGVNICECSPQQQKVGEVNFHTVPLVVWLWQGRKSGITSRLTGLGGRGGPLVLVA